MRFRGPHRRVNVSIPAELLQLIDAHVAAHPDYRGRSDYLCAVVERDLTEKPSRTACSRCNRRFGDKHAYCSNCVAKAAFNLREVKGG